MSTVGRHEYTIGRAVVLRTNTPRPSPDASLRASKGRLARPVTSSRRSGTGVVMVTAVDYFVSEDLRHCRVINAHDGAGRLVIVHLVGGP